MILGIEKELSVFIQAILAGNLVYLTYCAICVLRRIIPHNLILISIEDIVFWIGTGLYVFAKIEQTSDGKIRWYFVLGVALGGALTHSIIQNIRKKHIAKSKKTM